MKEKMNWGLEKIKKRERRKRMASPGEGGTLMFIDGEIIHYWNSLQNANFVMRFKAALDTYYILNFS